MMRPQPNREQRWSNRQSIETGLRFYATGQRPWPGRVRNLSIGGMFAEIDTKNLSPNARVDVAFVLRRGGDASHHRLPARVIWVGTDGAGLMFTDISHETLQVLRAAFGSHLASAGLKDVV